MDDFLVERMQGDASRVWHRPVPREVVMTFDRPWETANSKVHFFTVFHDEGIYRMYYMVEGGKTCYAESDDGINWKRPDLDLFEYEGSTKNNIVMANDVLAAGVEGAFSHGLVPFLDINPAAPPHERYKALADRVYPYPAGDWAEATKELTIWTSADGVHWTRLHNNGILTQNERNATMDSQNVVFWDPQIEAYRLYYRWSGDVKGDFSPDGRNIKTATSRDLVTWPPDRYSDKSNLLRYVNPPKRAEFYTNVIKPYHRAPHIYIGMPKMYNTRGDWENIDLLDPGVKQLPDTEKRLSVSRKIKRPAAFGECHLMWSRDGALFELSPSAFITPGPERPDSWSYGEEVAWHIVESASVYAGAPPELTFYKQERFYFNDVQLRRYTLRLDGFASIHASTSGGEFVTPPLRFEGSHLSMNFATSTSGSVKVEIQDLGGEPIAGFSLDNSAELFGDTVDRRAMWDHGTDVSALAGREVRLRFVMRDAHLYAIKFGDD